MRGSKPRREHILATTMAFNPRETPHTCNMHNHLNHLLDAETDIVAAGRVGGIFSLRSDSSLSTDRIGRIPYGPTGRFNCPMQLVIAAMGQSLLSARRPGPRPAPCSGNPVA